MFVCPRRRFFSRCGVDSPDRGRGRVTGQFLIDRHRGRPILLGGGAPSPSAIGDGAIDIGPRLVSGPSGSISSPQTASWEALRTSVSIAVYLLHHHHEMYIATMYISVVFFSGVTSTGGASEQHVHASVNQRKNWGARSPLGLS